MTSAWERVDVLDEAESMRMLSSVRWGRCAWSDPEGPRILPVNLTVVNGDVFFRTGLYGSLAEAADGRTVAIEADELDDRLSTGWSVVALGRADQVQDPTEIASLFPALPQPWAPGPRPTVVRITVSQITGRRFMR